MQIDDNTNYVKCGIREFIGPLDSARWDLPSLPNRPLLGIKTHLRYARERVNLAGFSSEVSLTLKFERRGFTFELRGRADGLIEGNTSRRIEEVKSLTLDGSELKRITLQDLPSAQLQLALYCYALSLDDRGPVFGSIVLKSVFDHQEHSLGLDWSPEDVRRFLEVRADELLDEYEAKCLWLKNRREIAPSVPFPFPTPRPIQSQMIEEIDAAYAQGTDILMEAPTGTGKTAVALFAAIKSAYLTDRRVVFVTAKTTGQKAAEAVLEHLRDQGLKLSSVTLTARKKVCLQPVVYCHPDHCSQARDHHEKLRRSNIVPILRQSGGVDRHSVIEAGRAEDMCPFEISLEVALRVDVLICDYNYIFHPLVRLRRFFEDAGKGNLLLVVDEAHNLVSRSRDYYSSTLSQALLASMQSDGAARGGAFGRRIQAIALDAGIELDGWAMDIGLTEGVNGIAPWEPDVEALRRWQEALADLLLDDPLRRRFRPFPGEDDVLLDVYRRMSHLLSILDSLEEDVRVTYIERDGNTLQIGVLCVDASEQLRVHLKSFHSTIAMSATLSPDVFYRDTLGLSSQSILASFPSPFPRENQAIMIVDGVTTRYRERSKHLPKIAKIIQNAAMMVPGNYAVYVPSYAYLRQIQSHFEGADLEIFRDGRGLDDQLRQGLLRRMMVPLKDSGNYRAPKARLLLAVQGGSFAEAIEWPMGVLQGVFVVGPGLPRVGFETERLRSYYQSRFGNGFEYAYLYPGMARVIQSAGRLIRRHEDKGIIMLLDARFGEELYAKALPRHWYDSRAAELITRDPTEKLAEFWQSHGHQVLMPDATNNDDPWGDEAYSIVDEVF